METGAPTTYILLTFASDLWEKPCAVPPPFGCSPLAWRPPTLDGAPMLAIGAGGRAGSMVPPPGARGQPWRYTQRGRAPGRHLILGGTSPFILNLDVNGNLMVNLYMLISREILSLASAGEGVLW